MEIDGTSPDAQGANATDSQTQQQPGVEGQQAAEGSEARNGFQKRVDQLTGDKYALIESLNKKDEHIAQLISQMTELARSQREQPVQQAAPQEDFGDVDPGVARMVQKSMQAMEAKMSSLMNQLGSQVHRQETYRVAQNLGVTDPAIQQRAEALAAGLIAKGLPINAEDAVKFALGEKALAEMRKAQATRDPQGRFTNQAPLPGAYNPPQNFSIQSQGQKPLPSNFDSLTADERIRILEQRGVDDLPF